MKTIYQILLVGLFLSTLAYGATPAPALTAEQKNFLEHYTAIQRALSADNLNAAKPHAAEIASGGVGGSDSARIIASALSLSEAREAFKALSKSAVAIAAGQPGFYKAHCPMVPNYEGDWVQTSKKIANPYFGKKMLTCGTIEDKS